MLDPLKIVYLFIFGANSHRHLTPFQGFSQAWSGVHWAMGPVGSCPADVLEPSQPTHEIMAQRLSGARNLVTIPLQVDALEQLEIQELGYFCVLFASDATTADQIDRWNARQPWSGLHIRPTDPPRGLRDERWFKSIHTHCCTVFERIKEQMPDDMHQAVASALSAWQPSGLKPTPHRPDGHFIFLPNQMVLARAFHETPELHPWIGESEEDYARRSVESAQAVLELRDQIAFRPIHQMMPPLPSLILFEPALYRLAYARTQMRSASIDRPALDTLRRLQTQRGLFKRRDDVEAQRLSESEQATAILTERRNEIRTQSFGIGLRAASTCSAVLRLTPAVNHVFPKLANFAANIRSNSPEARLKAFRLFQSIQNDLEIAVGPDRLSLIAQTDGPIKLVTDAPLEWLPLNGLPLSLRRDCSRINATPGNLMMGQLAANQSVTVDPKGLANILVISGLAQGDPLYSVMAGALETMRDSYGNKVRIRFVRTTTEGAFIDALNAFDGAVLVFDGHGAGNQEDPIGGIMLGDNKIDVWMLERRARIPPIVILSACHTHGIDGSSHATVANGFLALGARTVLGTSLVVGGLESAMFVARLLYRLADYITPALAVHKRALTWTEIVAGLIRMNVVSEILDQRVGLPISPARTLPAARQLQVEANMAINMEHPDWFGEFIRSLSVRLSESPSETEAKAVRTIARSQAIRYTQLGNPELILIDDGRVESAVLAEYDRVRQIVAEAPMS